ncbi:urea transporter [Persephonella sp. IF05-L8]|uniref:urea transporter n=1 Tax=Persephonella sp. IF05-L8 TaxID=1158338 RepID=UPI000496F826
MKNSYKSHLKAVLNSYSEIFFVENYIAGGIFLLSTFINPNIGLAGIISFISAYLFARFLNMEKEFLSSGFYTYNPLLVGLSIGYLFKITPITIFFTITAGIFTLIFSVMLHSVFSYYLRLPIFSLPFVIISSIIYLSASNYSNLFVVSLYPHTNFDFLESYLPLWIIGYLKSLGTILFLPDAFIGLIFAITIFLISRILFMLSVIGYYTGTLVAGFLTGSFYQAFSDISHFNFILIAMVLGGIFLIPSVKTYFIAIIGVVISTIILSAVKTFWSLYGIPAFTLPFNFISLTILYVLGILGFPLIARVIRKTPEETLDFYLTNVSRFKGYERTLHLPFSGKWTVWQGFDGKWTHKGSWRYAYDFVITDEEGKTYKNEGLNLEDYYAYRKPVLSPVRGRVVKVISHLPDNPIGQVDKDNNWGNLVIIHDIRGFYVEISHFAQHSIKVKEGDWVEIGTFLGLCGNSGYSPQPHIHIQVQPSDEIGSYTLPFSFVSYISGKMFYSNNLPKEGETVEPVFPDKSLELKMSFILDYQFSFDVLKDGQKIDTLHLTVKMAPDGTFYFASGKGELYFGKYEGTFYFYRFDGKDPYLKLFFIALPRLPLFYKKGIQWEDYIPIKTVTSEIEKSVILFISSFNHNFAKVKYKGEFISENKIKGNVEFPILNINKEVLVELDDFIGFKSIKVDNIEIKLKEKIGGV